MTIHQLLPLALRSMPRMVACEQMGTATACAGDDDLRREVQVLLDQDSEREGILDRDADEILRSYSDTELLLPSL
jgi:hypothetical protein